MDAYFFVGHVIYVSAGWQLVVPWQSWAGTEGSRDIYEVRRRRESIFSVPKRYISIKMISNVLE